MKSGATDDSEGVALADGSTSFWTRVRRGLGAQAVLQLSHVIFTIASVPIILTTWDVERFGTWLILWAIPSYLAISDLGLLTAASHDMASMMGGGDRKGASRTFWAATSFLLIVSAVLMSAAGLARLVPVGRFLGIDHLAGDQVWLALFFLVGFVCLNLVSQLLYAVFFADGRYGVGGLMLSANRVADLAAFGITALTEGDIPFLAQALAGGRAFILLPAILYTTYRTDWISKPFWPTSEPVRRLAKPALGVAAFPLGNAMNIDGVVLVIGPAIGAQRLALFVTARTITRIGLQAIRSLDAVARPELARSWGRRNLTEFNRIASRLTALSGVFAVAIVVIVIVAGDELLATWTRSELSGPVWLFAALGISAAINSLWLSQLSPLLAANRHGIAATWYLAANAGLLLAVYAIARVWGLKGAAVILPVFDAAVLFGTVRAFHRMSGGSLRLVRSEFVQFTRNPVNFLRGATDAHDEQEHA